MKILLAIGLGSGIGGILRYLVSLMMTSKSSGFPLGTLTVNIIGSLLIGIVYGYAAKGLLPDEWKLFLAVGILGGFTTFSSFSYETVNMIRNQQMMYALIYVTLSVLAGIAATGIGLWMSKS